MTLTKPNCGGNCFYDSEPVVFVRMLEQTFSSIR